MTSGKATPAKGEQSTGSEGGLVLRDSTGSLYFIRESMLDSFRVEGEGLVRMTRLLKEKTGGRGGAEKNLAAEPLMHVQKDEIERIAPQDPTEMGRFQVAAAPPSTVMCPWFC
jgi:hypothetical protein